MNKQQAIAQGYKWLDQDNDFDVSSPNYTVDLITFNDAQDNWQFEVGHMTQAARQTVFEFIAKKAHTAYISTIQYSKASGVITIGSPYADFAFRIKCDLVHLLGD